jgi:PAS domain S-box-containing protein
MPEGLKSLHVALKESEERLERILDSSPFGFHQYDLTPEQQLVVTGGNRAAAELFGVDSRKQLGKRLEEAFPFLAATDLPAEILRAASQNKDAPPRELRVQIDSRPVAVRVSVQPIAPHRAAVFFEESLGELIAEVKDEAARFRSVFEHANDAMLVFRDGRIVECNAKAGELFGYPQSELLGKSIHELSPELQPDGSASKTRIGELENRALTIEPLCLWTHIRRDGSRVDVESSLSRALIGGRSHLVMVSRDLTQRNRIEEQQRQAQKMEAVGRLAGRLAHDFNNCLTVISGYSAWMKQYVLPEDPLYSQVVEIQKAGQNGTDMTRRLLSFSRHNAVELHPVDLNQVIMNAIDLIRPPASESIELKLKLQRPLSLMLGDAAELRQMMLNLVSNARDAMPRGGCLSIETRESAHVGEGLAHASRYLQLSVGDNGIGMDETVRSRAFDPYYTNKGAGRAGLGLSTVHGIVQRCGGQIEVSSSAGAGTTFTIFFPVQAGQAQAPAPEKHAPVEALFGTETVLVVDDHEQVRRLTTMTLQLYGYQVLESSDPREALAIAKRYPGKISLLVTDLVMPGLSGIELARALRVTCPDLGVVLMTAYADPKMAIEELEPPTALVEKPYEPDALVAKVREALHSDHRPARVLVVDDDPSVREFLCFLLEQQGYEVKQASSGREAIALIKAAPFDLLVTDLVMPEIEGLETIATLRKVQPELLIIAIAGYQDGRFLSIASKLGSSATLAKPLPPQEFLETVRSVLRPAARNKQASED